VRDIGTAPVFNQGKTIGEMYRWSEGLD
jgi:hypothetical protein